MKISSLLLLSLFFTACQAKVKPQLESEGDVSSQMNNELQSEVKAVSKGIRVGAERIDQYLDFLRGKRVGLIANQASLVGNTHLLDTLISLEVDVKKIFTPEHGFRGTEDAGAHVETTIDQKTGLPLISLYGDNKAPKEEQLIDLDILLFDLQDVGVRFYTYLSTLHYIMRSAAENGITVIVLDRPNPHMDVVDGPIMKEEFMSFVGLHPVPLLYGMSIGEYARMINEEKWLGEGWQCKLIVIACENLNRSNDYILPIAPSPNLPNMRSIKLYPSLALFEGTTISVGRGTDKPFQQIGHPDLKDKYSYSFVPAPTEGAKNPKLKGEKCFGIDLSTKESFSSGLDLQYLISFYRQYPSDKKFFNSFFNLLAGTDELKEQIENGWTAAKISGSWQADLLEFKKIRGKYLLYQ